MTPRCPSDLALEHYLLERTSSKFAPHVGACATCQSRVAQMEQEGQHFLQYVFPATVGKVEEAAGGKRASWKRWFVILPVPVAAAMAALLMISPAKQGPDDDYVGLKGSHGLGLTVFLGAIDGSRPVASGETIPASSALRFKVQATKPCSLWVVSVDGTGQVSRLYPTAGDTGAEISKSGALPGGALLDGRSGPERIFALCSPTPVSYVAVQEAMQRAVAPGDQGVRAVSRVPGLPDGTSQDSVLIEKKP